MAKRIWSLVTLLVLVLTECFTPMCCVLAENNAEPDFEVEETTGETTDTEEFEEITEEPTKIEETKEIIEETINTEEIGEIMEETTEIEEAEDFVEETIDTEKIETTEDIEPDDSEADKELNKTENENTDETISENEIIEDETEGKDIQNLNDESFKTDSMQNDDDKESNNDTPADFQSTGQTSSQVDTTIDAPQNDANKEKENIEEPEWTTDTITEEIKEIISKIRYFFKIEWDSQYIKYGRDTNNIWTITLKDPKTWASITIMDKNLWAESVGIGRTSYGYYFQWWNNHGVKTVNSSNKTTQKAVYKDIYYSRGYDGQWNFIVWGSDYWEDWNHYNNLWWNETKESSRYGACPPGYHIPTVKEWNQLLSIRWKIHTQDTTTNETVLRYSADYATRNIHTFKWAATQCAQWETECVDENKLSIITETLSEELKLPLAWSYDENGNFHDGLWVYWTSIAKDGNKAWVFDMNTYIWKWTDGTLMYKSHWHNIRCFQNVEPYVVLTISEPQNNDSLWIETNDSGESSLLTGDNQDEINNNTELQNNEENTQDSYPENDIPSDIESNPIIQDTTEDLVNEEINTKEYTITWKNEDGSIRDTTTVAYGQMPTHEDPVQSADAHYSYEFTWWEPELKAVECDAEYKAKYTYIPMEYTITWKNEDGSVIDTTKVTYGQTPTHKNPVQPADEKYSYKFAWWEPKLSEVKWNAEYRAKYEYIVNKFTITRENEDWTIIDTTEVAYGEMPRHENPIQPADEKYSYEFAWWDSEITEVTWPAEYRATYKYITNKYIVTWKNENETVLGTGEVEYGAIPTYDGKLPTKESSEEFEYTFAWREPEIEEIKWDVVYKATYTESPIIQNEESNDWNEVQTGSLEEISQDNEQTIQELQSESQNNENIASWTQWDENEWGDNTNEDSSINTSKWENTIQEWKNSEEGQWFFGWLWETLKSFFLDDEDEYLRGSETINDIIVSVEAEEWTFPAWTEVVIKWVSEDRLETIQTSLVEDENNNVTENAQIVAFDISFIYSWKEIQPEKEVLVKFNYKDNSDFQWASISELSVFHIDDETDEWEEIDVANKDGDEIEILAISFSTYAVVAQKGLRWASSGGGIYDQMPDFEFTEIMIRRPDSISNGPAFYIIMDRNLWATSTDTNSTDSYGYMYQWWNNYWFPGTWASLPSNQVVSKKYVSVNLTEYWPVYIWKTQYYSGVFITAPDKQGLSNREDWASTSNNDIWWDTTFVDEARQWPCPSGWHVPSMTEWSDAMAYWKAWSGNWSLNNFTNYLKLPKAGSRARSTADLQKSGEWWYYTSTPDWNKAYSLKFTANGNPQIYTENNRIDAQSIRCFKDELICEAGYHDEWYGCVSNYMTWHCMTWNIKNGYYTWYMDDITIEWTWWTWYVPMCEIVCDEGFHENDNMCIWGFVSVTFDLNWWRWYDGSIWNRDSSIEMGVDISEVRPKQDPYKNGYMFMWWFDESSNSSYRFKFQWTTITWNLILTAHWAPFNDIVYTWTIDGNERKIVLMDRNMWATAIWVWRNASTDSYGFYYEWWNNYGFYFDPSKTINSVSADNARVNAGWYGPNTSSWRYYGETFINITDSNRMDWSSVVNNNLWWWWWDNATNDYDNRTSERYTRQWPCPKGYHVPSLGEWRDLVRLFYNNNWLGNFSQPWPDYVWTAGGNAMKDEPISTTNRDIFANTFNIPVAWRVQRTYVWERYWNKDNKPRAPFWSSSIKNWNGSLWFEVKFDGGNLNIWWWNDERSQLKPLRCFKNLDDYTVTWKNYNGTVLETDYYVYEWATPTYNWLEDPIKDELSEFTWWYLEGDENQTIVDLSTESVDSDRVYIAKFIPIAPEDAYIVAVDIDPLSWWNVDKDPRYNSGDTITLTWIASSWYEFLWWFTGNDIVSLDNPYVFIADDSAGTGFTAVFSSLYSIYTWTNNELWWTIYYEVVDITRQWKLIRFTATPAEFFALNKWILNWVDIATWESAHLDVVLSWNINLTGYFIQVANLPCNFNGETIPNGESVTWYQSDSATCPNACVSQVATCNNGEWNVVNFEMEYSYSSCNYGWFTCSAEEYPLQICPENWICSSCTGYSVVDNACNEQFPVYKLEWCSDHYHINGNICELDTYTVMIQSSDVNSGAITTWSITVPYGTNIFESGNIVTIWNETSTAIANPQTWQYNFAFVDWTDTCGTTVTTWCTITANFQSSLRTYTLDLVIGTWIETIYYKVNGASEFINTWITTTISGVEAWSTIYAYAEAKDWYTYSETSESNPWSVIVTWDNIFSPEAVAGSVQYIVYHYVKKVWSAKYDLAKIDTWIGITDEILVLSWLSKENEFPCAHYDRWSLTWTEDWPWEIVTQTTIKWDRSTKIYLYYTRNNRRIILSGDAHIESLEIDGNESTEAVRECGGEVPINAKPKPGYHFVRWDKEEKKENENSNEGLP